MADRRYIEIEVEAGKALRQLDKIAASVDKTAKSSERAAKGIGFVSNALKGFVGFKVVQTLTQIPIAFSQMADASRDMDARLAGATDTAEEASYVYEQLFQTAARNGVAIGELVTGFTKLAVAVPTAETEKLLNVMDTTATVLSTTGASTQQVNAVMLQLSQGLASGALQGDEFRSVFENAPVLLRAWQEAAGLTDTSLRDLSSSAKLTTESFLGNIDAIREISQEMTGLTEPPTTVARGFETFKSGFTTLAGAVEAEVGIFEGLGNVLKSIGVAANEAGQSLKDSATGGVLSDPDELRALRQEMAANATQIEALSSITRRLTLDEQSYLVQLTNTNRELRKQDPLQGLVDARTELERMENQLAKNEAGERSFWNFFPESTEALKANVDAQRERVLVLESNIDRVNEAVSGEEDLTEVYKTQGDAMERLMKQVNERADATEAALKKINDLESEYEKNKNAPGGAGALDNARITSQISEIENAIKRGDFGLAREIQEKAAKGLEDFAKNADTYLENVNFQNLKDRLATVTLDAYTEIGSTVGQSMTKNIAAGMESGFQKGRAVIENEEVRMVIVPDLRVPFEEAVLEGGARE